MATIDELYMQRCLQLARCGAGSTSPNPMVGAVIVCDGRIIGEGYHIRAGEPHAEVNAVNSVSEVDRPLLARSTMYVSLEPCSHYGKTPPCCDMIIARGIARVVVGMADPNSQVNGAGIERMRAAGIDVTVGVLEEECLQLNRAFFVSQVSKRPYVTLKWAQSSDGFIDLLLVYIRSSILAQHICKSFSYSKSIIYLRVAACISITVTPTIFPSIIGYIRHKLFANSLSDINKQTIAMQIITAKKISTDTIYFIIKSPCSPSYVILIH